ncbi:hypothetical protein PCARR_a2201 [Pseudoalteromonas carrageenovora IAM 12662]|uniref:Uncharacterized protein n=1 Tax=Pseudoalteromonas carrageenovora IAM 12662 TaxID=1314868 RepID=A0ABR9ETK4_PSEVC|nr:hypothetical protein [Pseudoalteromonas carrageenovora IAM 12662]
MANSVICLYMCVALKQVFFIILIKHPLLLYKVMFTMIF